MGRLPATERRAAVLDTACHVFARCSYRSATTAEIARESGVSEPILYRHFVSKQALYLSCIDEAWRRVRAAWETAVAAEDDPDAWLPAMGRAFYELREQKAVYANLWVQALAGSGDEPELRKHLRRHLRDVHEFVAGVIRQGQAVGAVPAVRDARAEAWIFISIGLLVTIAGRLGGLAFDDLEGIRASRRDWLTGNGS